jgi:REP element-mobilizing transposase RayT
MGVQISFGMDHEIKISGIIKEKVLRKHLWAQGYWVASSTNVTDEVWKEYIETQCPPEPDDNFNVV